MSKTWAKNEQKKSKTWAKTEQKLSKTTKKPQNCNKLNENGPTFFEEQLVVSKMLRKLRLQDWKGRERNQFSTIEILSHQSWHIKKLKRPSILLHHNFQRKFNQKLTLKLHSEALKNAKCQENISKFIAFLQRDNWQNCFFSKVPKVTNIQFCRN